MNPNSHPKFTNTLFASTSPFVNSSNLFPSHDRRIGLTVTCGYHPEAKRVMVLVEDEQPSFISSQTGEYIEPDKVEGFVRQKLSQLVETCRRQAKELTEHANRLEKLYTQNLPLIDTSKIDTDDDHKIRDQGDGEVTFHKQTYKPHATHKPTTASPKPSAFKPPAVKSSGLNLDDI